MTERQQPFSPDNPNLAKEEAMAYAEKPYRDMQLNAKKAGNTRVVEVLNTLSLLAAQKEEFTQQVGGVFAQEFFDDDEEALEERLARAADWDSSYTEGTREKGGLGALHIIRTANRVASVLQSQGETKPSWITSTDQLKNNGPRHREATKDAEMRELRAKQGMRDIKDMLALRGTDMKRQDQLPPDQGVYESATNLGVTLVEHEIHNSNYRSIWFGVKRAETSRS